MPINILGLLSLLWQILKMTVANDTVNKAMDHWIEGTSNAIDDALWALLEAAAGVKDEEQRKLMLDTGLKSIEEQYRVAKLEGRLDELKRPTRSWAPLTMAELHASLTGESASIGEG